MYSHTIKYESLSLVVGEGVAYKRILNLLVLVKITDKSCICIADVCRKWKEEPHYNRIMYRDFVQMPAMIVCGLDFNYKSSTRKHKYRFSYNFCCK